MENMAWKASLLRFFENQSEIARQLGICPQTVSDWFLNKRDIPHRQASRIELLSGGAVLREEMRPNDWMEIWPELIPMRRLQRRNGNYNSGANEPFIERRSGRDRRRGGRECADERRSSEGKVRADEAEYRSDPCVND